MNQIKKALLSLLWAWKGKFKKFLGELDRIMASFWAGLVRFGPQFGLGWVGLGAQARYHSQALLGCFQTDL